MTNLRQVLYRNSYYHYDTNPCTEVVSKISLPETWSPMPAVIAPCLVGTAMQASGLTSCGLGIASLTVSSSSSGVYNRTKAPSWLRRKGLKLLPARNTHTSTSAYQTAYRRRRIKYCTQYFDATLRNRGWTSPVLRTWLTGLEQRPTGTLGPRGRTCDSKPMCEKIP